MAADEVTVWCLLIDHEKKAITRDAFAVEVSPRVNVDNLKKKIKEEKPIALKHIDPSSLIVWGSEIDFADLDDLDTDEFNEKLKRAFSSGKIVNRRGPKREVGRLTDLSLLIEVPEVGTATLHRPITPERQMTAPTFESTPRKSKTETKNLIEGLLAKHDATLREYLAGPPWKKFWKAPPSEDREVASFLDNIEIPEVLGAPVLLLHMLGEGVVDESIVDNLFTTRHQFLVNTSGSGKIRLLFEGLCKHWGFFFTTVVEEPNFKLGSPDIMEIIDQGIRRSHGFEYNPKSDYAYERNNFIARRRVHQVLKARILLFKRFLKIAKETCANGTINGFKKHWLFLQLCSVRILDVDIFTELSGVLKDASDDYLLIEAYKVQEKLRKYQKKYQLHEKFYFVLDEAQKAIESLNGCFRSERSMNNEGNFVERPVLKPIVSTFLRAVDFPIIISGTDLSIDIVNDVVGSAATAKSASFPLATKTGAFDDPAQHEGYIKRYMPSHIANSDFGQEFIRRAYNFTRGRHRFTASLMVELLKTWFRSPHKILNACVKKFCGFHPTDGEQFVNNEEDIEEGTITIIPLDFSRIRNDPERKVLFRDVLYSWLMDQKFKTVLDKNKFLVEMGFARFVSKPGETVVVDEPLVLLAATYQFLRFADGFTLGEYVVEQLGDAPAIGARFESLIVYGFACLFDGKRKLCDIFDFGETIPEWAKQTGELVSVVRRDGEVEVSPFHLAEFEGAVTVIGSRRGNLEETVEWFKNPTSLFCLPYVGMGPDIVVFVRLASGLILALIVQVKWRSTVALRSDVLKDAKKSLDPSKFFAHSNQIDKKYQNAREDILEGVKDLSRADPVIQTDKWFIDGIPLLRVIVSYPATARQEPEAPYVFLNMEAMIDSLKNGGAIRNLALTRVGKTGNNKRARGDKFADKPRKKQR